jgi:ubiquinone/menaquinone biosynthesis C-methylase UbiE
MQSRLMAKVYARWWRPIAFALSTGFRLPRFDDEAEFVLRHVTARRGPWLDLSCGPGTLTRRLLARAGGRPVVAVDLSAHMLAAARKHAPGADLVRADAAALPFADATFGAVVNLAALDLYPSPERVVAEAARVLAPCGAWVASGFVSRRAPQVRDVRRVGAENALTEARLREMSRAAGLAWLGARRYGNYVIAWAHRTPF